MNARTGRRSRRAGLRHRPSGYEQTQCHAQNRRDDRRLAVRSDDRGHYHTSAAMSRRSKLATLATRQTHIGHTPARLDDLRVTGSPATADRVQTVVYRVKRRHPWDHHGHHPVTASHKPIRYASELDTPSGPDALVATYSSSSTTQLHWSKLPQHLPPAYPGHVAVLGHDRSAHQPLRLSRSFP